MIHPFEDKNARAAGIAGAAMNVSLIGQLHRKGLLSDLDLSVILIFARIHLILEMPPELHDALAMLDRFRTPSVGSRRCPAPGEALTTAA